MTDSLRARIGAVQLAHMPNDYERDMGECPCGFKYQKWSELASHVADAVIAALDEEFADFGLWLAEEITGRTMTRIDLESCLSDWKAGELFDSGDAE